MHQTMNFYHTPWSLRWNFLSRAQRVNAPDVRAAFRCSGWFERLARSAAKRPNWQRWAAARNAGRLRRVTRLPLSTAPYSVPKTANRVLLVIVVVMVVIVVIVSQQMSLVQKWGRLGRLGWIWLQRWRVHRHGVKMDVHSGVVINSWSWFNFSSAQSQHIPTRQNDKWWRYFVQRRRSPASALGWQLS